MGKKGGINEDKMSEKMKREGWFFYLILFIPFIREREKAEIFCLPFLFSFSHSPITTTLSSFPNVAEKNATPFYARMLIQYPSNNFKIAMYLIGVKKEKDVQRGSFHFRGVQTGVGSWNLVRCWMEESTSSSWKAHARAPNFTWPNCPFFLVGRNHNYH